MTGDALLGRVVGERFELVSPQGAGGLSAVYRAHDRERPDSDAAVKVLHAIHAGLPEVRRRFARERQLAEKLGARVGAAARGQGEIDGRPWLALDLLAGTTLKARLSTGLPLAVDEALGIAIAMLDRVAVLHRESFAHRDLKPANLLLGESGSPHRLVRAVHLVDLDAAAPFGAPAEDEIAPGSPAYTAPEQLDPASPDPRADVYSAGVILFELLSGRRPWKGDPIALMNVAARAHVPSIRHFVPSLPAELEQLVRRALSFDPAHRFADADAMRNGLRG